MSVDLMYSAILEYGSRTQISKATTRLVVRDSDGVARIYRKIVGQ